MTSTDSGNNGTSSMGTSENPESTAKTDTTATGPNTTTAAPSSGQYNIVTHTYSFDTSYCMFKFAYQYILSLVKETAWLFIVFWENL